MPTSAASRDRGGWIASLDAVGLALGLTLLDLLLHPIGAWWIRPFLLGLAAAALVLPSALRSPGVWFALAILAGVRVFAAWPLADNHAYLLCYWCLAIALCLRLPDPRAALAWNGRWLIGLAFAFAVLWKLGLSPDYRDATFFQVMLVNDPRFEGVSRLLGGMTPELLESARLALTQHVDVPLQVAELPALPSRLVGLARFATLWTGLLEAAVALAFLWPSGGLPARARHVLLLLFCATTYAVAPVEGFGWLLIAMGVAQTRPEQRGTRALYLAAFALVLFYREIPWALLLAERFGS